MITLWTSGLKRVTSSFVNYKHIMDKGSSNQELHARLQEALRECEKLRAENERLRAQLKFSPENAPIAEDKGEYSMAR